MNVYVKNVFRQVIVFIVHLRVFNTEAVFGVEPFTCGRFGRRIPESGPVMS